MIGALFANYTLDSYWELDFDLDSVADWYVRWDTLHVKFNPGDTNYVKIQPTFSAEDDAEGLKTPIATSYVVEE